jgi:hypothetical protein
MPALAAGIDIIKATYGGGAGGRDMPPRASDDRTITASAYPGRP